MSRVVCVVCIVCDCTKKARVGDGPTWCPRCEKATRSRSCGTLDSPIRSRSTVTFEQQRRLYSQARGS